MPNRPMLGIWTEGPAWTNFQIFQTEYNIKVLGFRSRGGEGQFDNPWVLPDSQKAFAAGHIASLQVQPKTGDGSNRYGIKYTDISAGKYDDLILKKFKEMATLLPPTGKFPFEVHSEANIQKGNPEAQPTSGTASEYPGFAKKIHALAKQAGVRKRLNFILSMTGGPWNSNEWRTWTKGLDRVIDIYAVDGYSQPKTGNKKELSDIVAGVKRAAKEKGKFYAIMETGCQEAEPGYKAGWYDRAGKLVIADREILKYVFFNTSNDGPGGWPPDTSPSSRAAFQRLVSLGIWKPFS